MALLAATILKIQNRWSVRYIAELTRRDTFIEDDPTFGVLDEDVLEQGVLISQFYAKTKRGTTDEDHPAVIEMLPYFLVPPGEQGDAIAAAFTLANSLLVSPPVTSVTDALPKTDTDFAGRFDGDDFENLTDVTGPSRPKRGTY